METKPTSPIRAVLVGLLAVGLISCSGNAASIALPPMQKLRSVAVTEKLQKQRSVAKDETELRQLQETFRLRQLEEAAKITAASAAEAAEAAVEASMTAAAAACSQATNAQASEAQEQAKMTKAKSKKEKAAAGAALNAAKKKAGEAKARCDAATAELPALKARRGALSKAAKEMRDAADSATKAAESARTAALNREVDNLKRAGDLRIAATAAETEAALALARDEVVQPLSPGNAAEPRLAMACLAALRGGVDTDGVAAAIRRCGPAANQADLGLPGLDCAGYDASHDKAFIVLNTKGEPLVPLSDQIDDNDAITLLIVAQSSELAVDSTPAQVALSVVGCEQGPSGLETVPLSGWACLEDGSACAYAKNLGKCRRANNESVEVKIKRSRGTRIVDAVTKFAVHETTRINLNMALAFDTSYTSTWSIRTPAGDSTGRVQLTEERVGLGAFLAVGVYFVARDHKKHMGWSELGRKLQVFLGFDASDWKRMLIAGLGFEITKGINFLIGRKVVSREQVLAEGSNLRPGDPFAGSQDMLPLRTTWRVGRPEDLVFAITVSDDLYNRIIGGKKD